MPRFSLIRQGIWGGPLLELKKMTESDPVQDYLEPRVVMNTHGSGDEEEIHEVAVSLFHRSVQRSEGLVDPAQSSVRHRHPEPRSIPRSLALFQFL